MWATLIIVLILTGIFIMYGVLEKVHNERNVKKIPLRINVNGIRGKSTATRLATAVLKEAGYKVVGKTTGTAARIIYWDEPEEEEIVRPPRGPNISEQIQIIKKAAEHGADALICECMAVKPEYQRVYQDQIIEAQITVITNVLEDHLDDMGPTTDQIAAAFAQTIPYNGTAIVPDCEYTEMFKRVADERGSRTIVIDDSKVPDEYLSRFDYKLFPHNCAVALAIAEALDIDEDTAFRGMLKAAPDPGALRFYDQKIPESKFCVVNALAANDPHSTLEIWENAKLEQPELSKEPVVIMNCREDRIDRTKQLTRDCLPFIENATVFVTGSGTEKVSRAYKNGVLKNVVEFHDLSGKPPGDVVKELYPYLAGRLIFCIGNVHGGGQEIVDLIIGRDTTAEQTEERPVKEKKKQMKPAKRKKSRFRTKKRKRAIRQAKKNIRNRCKKRKGN